MREWTTDVQPPILADRLCQFGLTEVAVPLIASAIGSIGVGAGTAGAIASVAAPALIGAGTGALTSAITGGKPLKGALYGGLTGGALGAAGQLFPETMSDIGLGQFARGAGHAGDTNIPGFATEAGDVPGVNITGPVGGSASGLSGAGSSLGALGKMVGNAGAGGGKKGGLSLADLAMGALNAYQNVARTPNYGQAPGPSTTAATRGPLFDKQLPPASAFINRSPTGDYKPTGDWYTYGMVGGGQPAFFQGENQLNLPGVTGMRRGGALSGRYAEGGGRRHVRGAGDGQSDSIPARLSEGEYVLTAGDVSRIGMGSTNAGVRKLDEMRSRIARDAGAKKHQGKVKHPLQYLAKASRR